MGVISGDVKITMEVRGTGDAPAKLDATTRAIQTTEAAAKSSTAQFVSLRGSISNVAQVASSAAGEMTRDLGSVVGLVSDASSKFGGLGTAVTGVVAVVGALFVAFEEIDKARFENVTRSLKELANTAGSLAHGLATAAANARELQGVLKNAEVRELTAQLAAANARGDKVAAAGITARLTTVTSGNEASALRAQAGDAFESGTKAQAVRTEAEGLLAKTEQRIAHLEGLLAQKAFVESDGRGGFRARDDVQAELAGLRASRVTQIGSLATLPRDAFARDNAAANALLKAADAVEKEGFTTAAMALANAATDALKEAAGKSGSGGAGANGAVRPAKDDKSAADLIGALSKGADAQDKRAADDTAREEEAAWRKRLETYDAASGALTKVEDSGASAANAIRDFTGALADSLPNATAFADALRTTSQLYDTYASAARAAADAKAAADAESDETKKKPLLLDQLAKEASARKAGAVAAIGSIGAIAKAGAEQIKNERARAGVLSIIELGLGTGLMFVPGMQAEAAGHLAAAAILGSVAIFGGGGGQRGRGGGAGSRAVRPVSDGERSSGAIVLNINAPWFGPSPQEAAAGLAAFLGRVGGTGFGQAG